MTAVVAALTGTGHFQTRLDVRSGPIFADEPKEVGGLESGPTPYELLSAALGACTTMTLRLYADHKGWELPPFRVEVEHSRAPDKDSRDRFTRHIHFDADLDEERRSRFLDIADRCPVHRTLVRGYEVATTVGFTPEPDPQPVEPPGQHLQDMELACTED